MLEPFVERLAGDHVGQRQPHAGDLAGQEFGVGLGPFGDVAVALGGQPVAELLTILGEEDQRCGVRRLQREHEREQHEAAAPRVELQLVGSERVVEDPHRDDDRLPHEELGGAEVAGDRLAERAEAIGVVLHPDADTPFGTRCVEVFAAPHVRASEVSRLGASEGPPADPEHAVDARRRR